jgi:hypothetical protein
MPSTLRWALKYCPAERILQRSTSHLVTTGLSLRMFRGAGDSEREVARCQVGLTVYVVLY